MEPDTEPAIATPEANPDTATPAAAQPTAAKPTGADRRPVGPPRPRPLSASLVAIKPASFGYEQARHLLWRAGFGGSPTQIRTLVKWGPTKSVDYLLDFGSVEFEPVTAETFDKDIMRPDSDEERGALNRARRMGDEAAVSRIRAERQEAQRVDREQMGKLQRWWIKRMIETPRPLEEKMTLFWHGLLATSYRTIEDSYHMFMQNQLFRQQAVGNYGKLLYAIIRDPAMIAYLNNNQSKKGKPNENLARELMELFSLGVGNYSEKDIKEGARALTGYTFNDDDFSFERKNHDGGSKTILGRSGTLDGEGFVGAILAHPACSRHVASRLYRFFVSDVPSGRKENDQIARTVIDALAGTMVAGSYEIKPVLRRLFLSEHFYQPQIMNELIKSPTELVVGAIRQFNTPARDLGMLSTAMNMMGQNVFYPPSVKGWDGGRSWINTATMFVRQNIACFLLTGRTPTGFDALANVETFDPGALLRDLRTGEAQSTDPGEIVDELLRFSLGRVRAHNREALLAFVQTRGGTVTPDVLTQALLLVTAMPEYQMC